LTGWIAAEHTQLPRFETLADVEWRLGVAATGLDLETKQVHPADGQSVTFDRLLIATGTRARPWPNQTEAGLEGVFTLRGRDDAKLLSPRLAAKPRRVLVIGGGFTGSKIASACCELALPITLVEHGTAPQVGALGGVIAERVATLQREAGVDLCCQVTVTELSGDAHGQLRRAHLSDGSTIDTEVAVVALGRSAIRNGCAIPGLPLGRLGSAVMLGAAPSISMRLSPMISLSLAISHASRILSTTTSFSRWNIGAMRSSRLASLRII
jgi:NADPH-dependent 2,4-dienoyl-CoA reductase/sulfur reductase-like enzyme